ncbi:MAG TPA: AMP-binding protein [Burkholderiales bacterium]|nr:AMP-binding protein [Burkholderiales bacterium]
MNLAHHLARAAAGRPDAPALARGSVVVADFRAMATRVARLAGALRGCPLAPGDRVAIVMANAPVYAEAMYACWWAGLAALPVNAKLHVREIAYILDHSAAGLVLFDAEHAAKVAAAASEAASRARLVDVTTAEFARFAAAAAAPLADAGPDDLAWLFYTSGTTGRPKGAMLTHRNLLAMTTSYFVDIDPPEPGGAQLHAAPMSHGSGLYMLPSIAQGNAQVIPDSGGFEPDEILALIRAWPGLSMFAAPTMVKRLVDHPAAPGADVDNLRVIVWGGAPMYVADVKAAVSRFGFRFAQLYGQGESPMTITGMTRAMLRRAVEAGDDDALASAGIAQSVVQVRVAGEDDRALPAGVPGEVLVRGDSVMKGYWRDEEASSRTLRGGWLHTGDIGSLDGRGFLTLRDRSKDVVISGGANIYPREIEEVLLAHPGVAECAVVGVPDPDWGESVLAFVVARPGAVLDAAALDALCLANIARFKRPRAYRFIAALPKNAYGKILKTELRALVTTQA